MAIPDLPHKSRKILGLELIRSISALAVLFWHYQHFWYVADRPVNFVIEQQPLYWMFWPFYEYGFYGVQVFWCVSGFIFFWKYRDAIAGKLVSQRKFFVLRFSRLYPLHLCTLLLVSLLQLVYVGRNHSYFVYQNNDVTHFVLQLLLASNWRDRVGSFNGPIWSISVEVLVYLLFFLSLRCLGGSAFVNIAATLLYVWLLKVGIESPIAECVAFFLRGRTFSDCTAMVGR